ncbi:glycosyltransferase family 2 protein [Clostridium perfringens]|uniref:glycosyltransferase family 2 protein n=1 Tax=Clostridium perfringens TaxID=1502 RepID=UPI0039EB3A33
MVINVFEVFILILAGLLAITSIYMLFQNLYSVFISFFGYGKAVKDYFIQEDKTRFLILIAAHNEEAVIADTIENIRKIDYNPDLFDIYVVNDNSTDNTKKICDDINIPHIDTDENLFEREGVGKPAGIQYALRALGFEKLIDKYDLIMVLDADNYVDPNILKDLNSQWQQKGKPEAIQTYLDSKNTTSLLANGYATAYWITNRFFQLARYRIGLDNAIGGTGFVVRVDWLLNNGGFRYKSLTEDLEMEIEIVKSNGKILWNHFVRIYDEKPDSLRVSIRQRTRWAQGHWYVAFSNFFPLVKRIIFSKSRFKYFDQLLYLFGMGRGVQLLLLLISIVFIFVYFIVNKLGIFTGVTTILDTLISFLIPTTIFNLVISLYAYVFLTIYALKKDGNYDNIFKSILSLVYVGTTYIYTQMIGLLKCRKQNVWVKTPHKHTRK